MSGTVRASNIFCPGKSLIANFSDISSSKPVRSHVRSIKLEGFFSPPFYFQFKLIMENKNESKRVALVNSWG